MGKCHSHAKSVVPYDPAYISKIPVVGQILWLPTMKEVKARAKDLNNIPPCNGLYDHPVVVISVSGDQLHVRCLVVSTTFTGIPRRQLRADEDNELTFLY